MPDVKRYAWRNREEPQFAARLLRDGQRDRLADLQVT